MKYPDPIGYGHTQAGSQLPTPVWGNASALMG